MLKSLLKYKNRLKFAGVFLALAASVALVWFTINTPEPGKIRW